MFCFREEYLSLMEYADDKRMDVDLIFKMLSEVRW